MVTNQNKNTDFKVNGKWVLSQGGGRDYFQTPLGRTYRNMLQRAKLGGSYQKRFPKYRGTSVHEDFLDAQKFCDWAVQQSGYGRGWELDKDLLKTGNRIYGPNTCCFLPCELNLALKAPKQFSCIRLSVKSGWTIRTNLGGEKVLLKNLPSRDVAVAVYSVLREALVCRLAVKYSLQLDPKAYAALLAWKCT